jgi:hypothetical protein
MLVDRKCYSCDHRQCAECPIYVPTPTKDELITLCASQAQQIAQLREALTALEWKLITPTTLPTVGDEIYSPTQNQYLASGSLSLRNGVYCVSEPIDAEGYAKLKRLNFTHFRPINTPDALLQNRAPEVSK